MLVAAARTLKVPPPVDTLIGDADPVAPTEAPVLSSMAVTVKPVTALPPGLAGAVNATETLPMLVVTDVMVGASGAFRRSKPPLT
jgi:hypothetical protein